MKIKPLTKEKYAEVRCDYNNGGGFWTVDAWTSNDPDAEGKVIAVINDKTADVYYVEPEARYSPLAQEAIKNRVILVQHEAAITREKVPVIHRLLREGQTVFWIDDHLHGWGKIAGVKTTTNHRGEFLAAPDTIVTVSKVDGFGEIETTADCLFLPAEECLYNGKAVVWNHFDAEAPFFCPDEGEYLGYDKLDGEKEFEVDIFILGTNPTSTKETVTIKARTAAQAERWAVKPDSGWGVLESRPAGTAPEKKNNTN